MGRRKVAGVKQNVLSTSDANGSTSESASNATNESCAAPSIPTPQRVTPQTIEGISSAIGLSRTGTALLMLLRFAMLTLLATLSFVLRSIESLSKWFECKLVAIIRPVSKVPSTSDSVISIVRERIATYVVCCLNWFTSTCSSILNWSKSKIVTSHSSLVKLVVENFQV